MRTLLLASALPLLVLAVACGDADESTVFGSGGSAGSGAAGKAGSGGTPAAGGKSGGSSGGTGGESAGRGGASGSGGTGGSPAAGRGGSAAGGAAGEAGAGGGADGGTTASGGGSGASGEAGGAPVGSSPVATINHPGDGETRMTGTMIPFVGLGMDAEDGPLMGASLVWTSDVEGSIGTGNNFNRALDQAGTQIITLTVTDSDGNTGTDSVTLQME